MTQDPTLRGVGSIGPMSTSETREARQTDGAAFRALLDQLQEKTRQIRQDGEELSEPAELAGAVDRARASIDDALSLSDQLLEAYRAAQSVSETAQEDGQNDASV